MIEATESQNSQRTVPVLIPVSVELPAFELASRHAGFAGLVRVCQPLALSAGGEFAGPLGPSRMQITYAGSSATIRLWSESELVGTGTLLLAPVDLPPGWDQLLSSEIWDMASGSTNPPNSSKGKATCPLPWLLVRLADNFVGVSNLERASNARLSLMAIAVGIQEAFARSPLAMLKQLTPAHSDGKGIPDRGTSIAHDRSATAKSWLTKAELAEHFKCDVRTITSYMQQRILPYVKNGHFVRFDLAECDRALEQFRVKSLFEKDEPAGRKESSYR